MNLSKRRTPAGFTLVELLVVITIIAILVGLISVAAVNVLWNARQTRIKVELDALDMAMKAYKEKVGSYPPDFQNSTTTAPNDVIANHLARYSRATHGGAPIADVRAELLKMDAAEALVFWLGGFSAASGTTPKLRGFSADVYNPFGVTYSGSITAMGSFTGSATTPFFEFDQSRLQDKNKNGYYEYYPVGSVLPYVYFSSTSYNAASPVAESYAPTTGFPSGAGTARPYSVDDNGDLVADGRANATSFQIISAGQDGEYGTTAVGTDLIYPAGINYSDGDNDNLTNFCDRSSLEAAKP